MRGKLTLALPLAALAAVMPAAAFAADGSTGGATNVPWYLSRAFGMAAYLLLFATVALGISIRTKGLDRLVARWRVNDLHTFLSLLAALFVVVHVVALLADSFIGFSVVEVLVPFASPYVPVWTGLGIMSAYAMIVVLASFPLRRYTGYRVWRTLHYLTFAVYLGALVHGLFTGTDSTARWAQAVYLVTAAAVVALVVARLVRWWRRELVALEPPRALVPAEAGNRRPVAPAVTMPPEVRERRERVLIRAAGFSLGAAAIAFVIFAAAALGPFHWFGHNGVTAQSFQADQVVGSGSGAAPAPVNAVNVSEGYSGTMTDRTDTTARTVTLQLAGAGAQPVGLALRIQVQPDAATGNQVVLSNSAMLADAGGSPICNGQVTSFDQSGFQAVCQGSGAYAGQTLSIAGTFDGGPAAQVQGLLSVRTNGGA